MYELLLTIHLLSAMFWVGAAAAINIMATRATPEQRGALVPHFEFVGNKVIGPISGVVLLAGFGLVAELDLSLTEGWILVGIVGWVLTAIIGFAVLGRLGKEMGEIMSSAAPDLARAGAVYKQLLLWSRIDLLIVVLVVVDMVVKPGA